MKVTKNAVVTMITLALVAMTAGCVKDDDKLKEGLVATVHTEDGQTIEFTRTNSGAIAMSEVGPADVPSQLAVFAVQKATALEVFRAVAPNNDAPIELEIDHAAATDADPRDLSLSFRTYTPHTYDTSCTATDDSTWFFDTFDGTGWNYADYYSYTAMWNSHDTTTQHLITHVCNHSGAGGAMRLKLLIDLSLDYTLNGIDHGERGIIYVFGSSEALWVSWAECTVANQMNAFRHGLMAPESP